MAANNNLDHYSDELAARVSAGSSGIQVVHQFLHLRDEAAMEHVALFSHEQNITIIESLLAKLGASSSGTGTTDVAGADGSVKKEQSDGDLAIVASVGTSTTQVYSKRGVLGAFLTGSTAMEADPRIAGEVLRQISAAASQAHVDAPIVLVNSIGYLVKRSLRVDGSSEEEIREAVHDEGVVKAQESGDAALLAKEQAEVEKRVAVLMELSATCASLGLSRGCIVQSREKPRLTGDWMEVLMGRLLAANPQGYYIVDFGGGGPDLHFCSSAGELSKVGADRSLRTCQPLFVSQIVERRYDESESFTRIVAFLREKISAHAAEHGVSPVVCKVFQTGMARQQHFMGNIIPSSSILVFDQGEEGSPMARHSSPEIDKCCVIT